MPADRVELLEAAREELFNAFKGMTSAEAKLLLLGEKISQQLLRDYGEDAVRWRRRAHVRNCGLTEQQLLDGRVELLGKREAFFDSLSALYLGRVSSYTKGLNSESEPPAP